MASVFNPHASIFPNANAAMFSKRNAITNVGMAQRFHLINLQRQPEGE